MHASTSVLQSRLAYNDDKYTSDRLILVAQQRAIGERQLRFLLIMTGQKEPQ